MNNQTTIHFKPHQDYHSRINKIIREMLRLGAITYDTGVLHREGYSDNPCEYINEQILLCDSITIEYTAKEAQQFAKDCGVTEDTVLVMRARADIPN